MIDDSNDKPTEITKKDVENVIIDVLFTLKHKIKSKQMDLDEIIEEIDNDLIFYGYDETHSPQI